jgi:APA family basic amino acid/polyamine antiporter
MEGEKSFAGMWHDALVTVARHPVSPPGTDDAEARAPSLLRGLGTWDGALITIGATLGSGIFLTTGDIARRLPHAGLILLLFGIGGLVTLAGALAYSELGAMFPRAGGQYHFLKEAYGPLWGFLFGWTSFLVIMTGGIATIAVGFGEYLGAFIPFFASSQVLHIAQIGRWAWTVSGAQLAGALALALLTGINYLGLRRGAVVQDLATGLKTLAVVGLAGVGLVVHPTASPDWLAPLPSSGLVSGLGLGMLAVLWTYDGWYVLTFSAGEMRSPAKSLPRGLIVGTLSVTALYLMVNWVYLRALTPIEMGRTQRVGEAAASALFGGNGARLVAATILLAMFGCLASNILCCSRIYLPMAQDRLFFGALARIHPRYLTPSTCLLAQGAWAVALALSGTYEQLYTWATFASVLFQAATGAAVFVLRRSRPDLPRPYRAWGHPWLTGLFVAACAALVLVTLVQSPRESLMGLLLVASGLPAFRWWRRKSEMTGRLGGPELHEGQR